MQLLEEVCGRLRCVLANEVCPWWRKPVSVFGGQLPDVELLEVKERLAGAVVKLLDRQQAIIGGKAKRS